MALLLDLFAYLSVIVHGLTIVAQSMALGGVLFLVFLARPFEAELGEAGVAIRRRTRQIAFWSMIDLVLAEGATLALQGSVLAGSVGRDLMGVLGAQFAIYSLVKIAGAVALALMLAGRGDRAPAPLLLAGLAVVLV